MIWMIGMIGFVSTIKGKSDGTVKEVEHDDFESGQDPYPHLADMKDFDYDGWMA